VQLLGSLILIFEIPPLFIEDHFLKLLPFEVFSIPYDLILIDKFMASVGDRFIAKLVSVSSKSLNLMTLLAPMDSIRDDITIVDLVALPSAEWAHLVTSKSLGFHNLMKVSNKLIFL
jgi:hypothetical protein